MGKSEILMLLAGVALSIMLAMIAVPMFSSGNEMADRQQIQQDLMSIRSSIPLILAFVPILVIITRFYQVYSSRTYSEMKSKNSRLNTQLEKTNDYDKYYIKIKPSHYTLSKYIWSLKRIPHF